MVIPDDGKNCHIVWPVEKDSKKLESWRKMNYSVSAKSHIPETLPLIYHCG